VALSLPFLSKKSIVGLDIGSSAVKVVEVARSAKGFDLLSLGVAHLPQEAIVQGAFLNASAIADTIREALGKARIKGRQVACAVSGHSVIVKKISLPTMTREELEESIRWEAEQYIPFDVNEVNLDFQILSEGKGDGQMDVLLVAAKKDMVDDYVQVMNESGLQPAIIDVASFAVENTYEANYDVRPDDVVALVNVGAQTVNINVLAGGVPAFTRDISTGGNAYTEEIQKSLSIGFDEAERIKIGGGRGEDSQDVVPQEVQEAMNSVTENVVGEICRSLDFFSATSAESEFSRILLCGGGSKVAGLEKRFRERTNVPVERLNPLARMLPNKRFDPEMLDEVGPSLGVGIGLALRRLDDQ
jgi:type IV pilus assembly protein PilM